MGDICHIWCSSIQGIYAQVTGGGKSAIGIYALFYIYIYIYISAKFGVVVLKAYMLDCKGVICHRYMCIVLYLYRSARFGVVVFKASTLN